MNTTSNKRPKKSSPTYISSIMSISLILFILGLIGVFFIQSAKLSQSVKENLTVQLILKENLNESDRLQYVKQLENAVFVKDATQVSKDEAAEMMKEELGEDFIETIGYNPLPDAINIHLKADYSNLDSIEWIKTEILQSKNVISVNYDEQLMQNVSNISNKVLFGLLVFLGLLIFVSYIIIDNTIKLAMFSKRFIIRSMQLVGATPWFITKPFIARAVFNGVLSAVIASLMLVLSVYLFEKYLVNLNVFETYLDFIIIFGGLISLGIVISLISTFFAVRKYLKMKLDNLY